ncbi:hypothetical protein AB0M87_02270 [Streptomyces sp. NPDC051320]|uniref:hypothetical protein n=1 Tax=Streptomyces sp. NPDC051320 TaxID=3154644 RepID=UPI003449E239
MPLVLNYVLNESASAYQQAVTSTDTHANGTHTWQGVSRLQNAIIFTFDHGNATRTGGSWTVLVYVLRPAPSRAADCGDSSPCARATLPRLPATTEP